MNSLKENQQKLAGVLSRLHFAIKVTSFSNWTIFSCVVLFISWVLVLANIPTMAETAMHSVVTYVIVALFLIIVVAAAISREVFNSQANKLKALATALRKMILQEPSYSDEHDNIQTSFDVRSGHSYSR